MALTMTGLEIEKTSGYWRAKGFRKPDMLERREWRMFDPETGKLTSKAQTLWGLLKQIH